MSRPGRRSRGSVTINDVARLAGVSAMTVSRVINRETNVREATRNAVLNAIEQLKYSPNRAAQSLAAGQDTHIGLLYPNARTAYLGQFLIGALEAVQRAGCRLVVGACESEIAGQQAEAARRLAQTSVDGVILPPPLCESAPVLAELAAARMPLVTVAMGKPPGAILNIRIDDFAAAFEMTNHLLELGHRNIGFIEGHPVQSSSHRRHDGFRAAIQEYGMGPEAIAVEQGYSTFRSGLIAAERLLSRERRPTAIFAGNDDMAAATISVAHRRGLAVPRDISVAGFDDTASATMVSPERTTVRQPISEMAAAAVERLLSDLRLLRAGGLGEGGEHVLDHSLVIRESTARPGGPSPPGKARSRGTNF